METRTYDPTVDLDTRFAELRVALDSGNMTHAHVDAVQAALAAVEENGEPVGHLRRALSQVLSPRAN